MVVLPNGDLLLVMFIPITNANGTYQENMILYRSSDLSDGTLFITASF
jgi:hypothetical protein